jgi:hypothetical protein
LIFFNSLDFQVSCIFLLFLLLLLFSSTSSLTIHQTCFSPTLSSSFSPTPRLRQHQQRSLLTCKAQNMYPHRPIPPSPQKKNTINLFCCPQLSQRRRGHRNQHNLRQGQNRTPHLRTPPPKLPSGSNYRKFNTRRSLNNHVSVESSVQVSMMHNIRFPGPGNPVSAETKKDKCLIVTVHPPLPPPFRLHPSTH